MYKLFSIKKFVALILLSLYVYVPLSVSAGTVTATDNVSISATVGTVADPGGGGGGGGYTNVPTSVIFRGFAYPGAVVHVLKNGTPKDYTVASASGAFTITLEETYNPNVLYTLYAIDKNYRQSLLLNYPVVVKNGYITQISGIRFAPTIAIDKTEVKEGDTLSVSGYALPNESIFITINGFQNKSFTVISHTDGTYQLQMSLAGLLKGNYNIYVNYLNDKRISKVIQFTISDTNIPSIDLVVNLPGDCNADSIINLVDFSVAAFWYGKPNPPRCVDTNNDNIINIVDFSILAFYWTG